MTNEINELDPDGDKVVFVENVDVNCDVILCQTDHEDIDADEKYMAKVADGMVVSEGILKLGVTSKMIEGMVFELPLVAKSWINYSYGRKCWLDPNQFNMPIEGKLRTHPYNTTSSTRSSILQGVKVYVVDRPQDMKPTKATILKLLRRISAIIVEFAQGYTTFAITTVLVFACCFVNAL